MSAVTPLPVIENAKLPASYEAAKNALAECSRLDECQAWADKAEAMASYARQAKDESLRKMALQIEALSYRCMGEILKERKQILSFRKKEWITHARQSFEPMNRAPCVVCNKYAAFTQAHHVVPLSIQYDLGYTEPDQAHQWLCPTHHVVAHMLINATESSLPDDKKDALIEKILDGVENEDRQGVLDVLFSFQWWRTA